MRTGYDPVKAGRGARPPANDPRGRTLSCAAARTGSGGVVGGAVGGAVGDGYGVPVADAVAGVIAG